MQVEAHGEWTHAVSEGSGVLRPRVRFSDAERLVVAKWFLMSAHAQHHEDFCRSFNKAEGSISTWLLMQPLARLFYDKILAFNHQFLC